MTSGGQSGWRGSGDTQWSGEGEERVGGGGRALPARPHRERQTARGGDTKEGENLGTGEEAASQVAAHKARNSERERRERGERGEEEGKAGEGETRHLEEF